MRPADTKLLQLLLVVTASTFAGRAIGTGAAVCVPRERDALLAFKRGITHDPASRLAPWRRDGDCCRWRGVRCSNQTGHVLELRLGNNGSIHDQGYYSGRITFLSGQMSPSLFSLEHLEHLDLGGNFLGIPSGGHSLGSLKSLRYLNLSGLQLDDHTLLPQLGNLSKLQYLDLSDTTFTVQLADLSGLARLPLLHHLDLSWVNLSTVHDWPHIVNMIPSLKVLYLSHCSLQYANQRLPHLNLTKLERLDLSQNYFDHTSESCWFWNLTSFKYLNLGFNLLYGPFPDTLGQMTSLQVFDFSVNKDDGHGGSVIAPRLMRNLCSLEVLDLGGGLSYGNMTELYESLPHCSYSRLQVLILVGNNITGTLPAGIAQFTSLVTLELSDNHLTGHVPFEIGLLTSLVILDLSENHLTGHVPFEIGMLTSLVILDLSINHLTGHVPFEIGMLNSLAELYLWSNNLTGVITEELFSGLTSLEFIDLSYNPLKIVIDPGRLPPLKLEHVSFASCQMGPRFPSWLQRLTSVDCIDMTNTGIADQFPYWFSSTLSLAKTLDFSDNQINGSLPKDLEFMSLDSLFLDGNQITGEIPPLPRNLTGFSIANNALSGRIPGSICKSQKLQSLDLSNNQLEGEFPHCLKMRNMDILFLSNNMFSGKFPSFLQSCTDITVLDLSENKLSGRLPTWIGDLKTIQYLRLSYNMFSGSLPISITNLGDMYALNLAGNRLSSVIPWNISNLTRMTYGNTLRKNGYTYSLYNLSVVTKRQVLYYGDRFPVMVSIDLSLNYLTGVIPEEIASLDRLVNLNLSWNSLTGKIPHKIGSMRSVESMDLSRNKLSGEIPPSLSNLTYLEWLDLSYNNLSGRIPSGSQLDTLYDNNQYMYSGNDGLCGPPLQRNCSGDNNAAKLGYGDQKGSARVPDSMFFQLGLGSGFVVGLWVVFCTMLFKQTWRIAYFRLFDKVYDKLYMFAIISWARLAQKTLEVIGN